MVDAIADLRRWSIYAAFVELLASSHRGNFRVLEFSIEHGHLHLIVEAFDWRALSNGVRGLEIRLARRINALTGRRGRAIADRFHARALGSPREVRNAYVYVLGNAAKHARPMGAEVDLLSSAPWFRGWSDERAAARARATLEMKLEKLKLRIPDSVPVARAETWLAGAGWKRRGKIDVHERPRTN